MAEEIAKKAGRPEGSLNKVSKQLKTLLANQMHNHITFIGQTIEEIKDPKEKIDAIVKVLPYIMPKATDGQLDNLRNIIIQYVTPDQVEEAEVIDNE